MICDSVGNRSRRRDERESSSSKSSQHLKNALNRRKWQECVRNEEEVTSECVENDAYVK